MSSFLHRLIRAESLKFRMSVAKLHETAIKLNPPVALTHRVCQSLARRIHPGIALAAAPASPPVRLPDHERMAETPTHASVVAVAVAAVVPPPPRPVSHAVHSRPPQPPLPAWPRSRRLQADSWVGESSCLPGTPQARRDRTTAPSGRVPKLNDIP